MFLELLVDASRITNRKEDLVQNLVNLTTSYTPPSALCKPRPFSHKNIGLIGDTLPTRALLWQPTRSLSIINRSFSRPTYPKLVTHLYNAYVYLFLGADRSSQQSKCCWFKIFSHSVWISARHAANFFPLCNNYDSWRSEQISPFVAMISFKLLRLDGIRRYVTPINVAAIFVLAPHRFTHHCHLLLHIYVCFSIFDFRTAIKTYNFKFINL